MPSDYPLQAWVEGHYARDCNAPQDVNPYRARSTMAEAWLEGWSHRDRVSSERWSTSEAGRHSPPAE
jgi:hypothetical protein